MQVHLRRFPGCSPPAWFAPPLRRGAGTARLEFALTVIVIGIVLTLALQRIAQLQALADQAVAETRAAQQRAAAALAEGCRQLHPEPAAAASCAAASSQTPPAGAAP